MGLCGFIGGKNSANIQSAVNGLVEFRLFGNIILEVGYLGLEALQNWIFAIVHVGVVRGRVRFQRTVKSFHS